MTTTSLRMDEDDLKRVQVAVGAYFRAAAALGSASLTIRHAALLGKYDEDLTWRRARSRIASSCSNAPPLTTRRRSV